MASPIQLWTGVGLTGTKMNLTYPTQIPNYTGPYINSILLPPISGVTFYTGTNYDGPSYVYNNGSLSSWMYVDIPDQSGLPFIRSMESYIVLSGFSSENSNNEPGIKQPFKIEDLPVNSAGLPYVTVNNNSGTDTQFYVDFDSPSRGLKGIYTLNGIFQLGQSSTVTLPSDATNGTIDIQYYTGSSWVTGENGCYRTGVGFPACFNMSGIAGFVTCHSC